LEEPVVVEQFLTWFVEHGAAKWREGALDVTSVSALPRVRRELLDVDADVLDENALLDAIEIAVRAAIDDLRGPYDQAALEQFGFTKTSHGEGRVERDRLAACKLAHKSARWMRLPSRRYDDLEPRVWLVKQVASSFMSASKPSVSLEAAPDGSTVPLSAVALLRLAALSSSEQEHFYDEFLNQAPRLAVPRYMVAPRGTQEALQSARPVQTKPLQDLLAACEINHAVKDPPLSDASYNKLRPLDSRWASAIRDTFAGHRTDNQIGALSHLYDYLSCQESLPSPTQVRQLDVVIVAGARRAMNYRLDELLRILYQASPTVVLAGLAPLDQTSTVPVSEADAMLYYLEHERHFDTTSIELVLDRRAADTGESIQHALGPIREKAYQLRRAVNVGLVTGPYHMRRMYYIAQHHWSPFAHVIASISPMPSGSSFDLRVLLDQSPASLERRTYGFRVFIQEYLKLLGGRVVAEH
jgi:hypothetical protein